jgi:subtilisin family serine protease
MNTTRPARRPSALLALAFTTCAALPAHAQDTGAGLDAEASLLNAATPAWMHSDVGAAWRQGWRGQGTTITVVDDFRSASTSTGRLGTTTQRLRHGEWTAMEAGMVAPLATVRRHDFASGSAVSLQRGLNVLNLSYGMMARAGYQASQIRWSAQENSIIGYARQGRAVVVKAAGNDGTALTGANRQGQTDYLNLALRGTASTIYVGALNTHGSTTARASLASYSNTPGSDATLQRQFLVVGVTGQATGLYGTSFAAPIVSGYAAVLGSKFTSATPTQITNQLLNTARQDTIAGYRATLHGRGEASLSRALAPQAIR